MITYSVAQVEALSGIKAHTLRIWERRYGFLKPMRTPTNIRYYTDDQLKKLLNFGILVRNGYRVSKLEKMSDQEVFEAVTSILADPDSEDRDEIKGLTLAMLEMNEEEFDNIFERQVIRKGFLKTITEMIYPFLQYVGVLWNTNKAMIAQEHFVSNLIRQKIVTAIERLSIPQKSAPSIVFFLLEGEDHEIGLLLANFIAKERGWLTYYLGQGVPVSNIKKVVDLVEPQMLMSMFVTPKPHKMNSFIDAVIGDGKVPFVVSGNSDNLEALEEYEALIKISSPDDFIEQLDHFYQTGEATAEDVEAVKGEKLP
jgi:DNA-binding transcriptional MerR regulator